ncbi:MAG: mannose-1-phosphate guanylyltransferase [Promethearchaeota archaeon]
MAELFVIIMAGGRGQRFWPYSRIELPKQCLPITSDKPMIIETIDRFFPLISRDRIFISTGEHLADKLKALLPDVNYIIEPMRRDTAACIALSTLRIQQNFPNTDAILIIAGSDYNIPIEDKAYFHNDLKLAIELAEKGCIVTFGVPPSRPATQYGYIRKGASLVDYPHERVYSVEKFVEKPSETTAEVYLKSGDFLWNSGMFIAKADILFSEMEKYMPELVDELNFAKEKNFEAQALLEAFQNITPISIDYGVMERSTKLVLIETSFQWDDVGDWLALERIYPTDDFGNILHGKAKFLGVDTHNCIISSSTPKYIATLGCKDLVIVNAEDCLFIAPKKEVYQLKTLLKKIEEKKLHFLQ